jgi:hypothetical protein
VSTTDEIMAAEGWLRIDKAAELVGVHVTTIIRAIEPESGLTGKRVGRRRYVSASSLLRFYADAEPITKRIKEHVRAAS